SGAHGRASPPDALPLGVRSVVGTWPPGTQRAARRTGPAPPFPRPAPSAFHQHTHQDRRCT
ncbi:hypothetical protein, partial [Streptomyces sp. S5]|uniref:hypothetical protein n=1 Tax=Streptomyces sp. S5 TaxID=1456735 RepID=UPI001969EC8E